MKLISIMTIVFLTSLSHASLTVQPDTQPSKGLQTESSSHYYNFGRVPVNSISTTGYTITNTGNAFLQFASVSMWGANFDSNDNCRSGMYPGQRCNFQIRYWPYDVGMHSGQFEIRFYGPTPTPETIRVDLWGESVWR